MDVIEAGDYQFSFHDKIRIDLSVHLFVQCRQSSDMDIFSSSTIAGVNSLQPLPFNFIRTSLSYQDHMDHPGSAYLCSIKRTLQQLVRFLSPYPDLGMLSWKKALVLER